MDEEVSCNLFHLLKDFCQTLLKSMPCCAYRRVTTVMDSLRSVVGIPILWTQHVRLENWGKF